MTTIASRTKRVILPLSLAMALSGCGSFGGGFLGLGGLYGDGGGGDLPYRAKVSRGADNRNFVASVNAGGVSVDDVRESVRFGATRYCIRNFGGSDADWELNPATGDWLFTRDGSSMVFSGRCTAR